jgi:hypothetical protein
MEETRKTKTQRILISLLIVGVLFVLPAGSWFYLQSGLNYRKKLKSELSDLGKAGDFKLINQNNLPVTPDAVSGRVSVVNFLSPDPARAAVQKERIAKVHQSFAEETDDVVFLTFVLADSTASMLDVAAKFGIKDNKHWFVMGADTSDWQRLGKDVFKIPDLGKGIALLDTNLTIRKFYDIDNNREMGRLVEHIALVLPKQKKRR